MALPTIWHGSEAETVELLRAIAHNCSCEFTSTGEQRGCCSAHTMLAHDQRALDGLLFARRMVTQWRSEEWCFVSAPPSHVERKEVSDGAAVLRP
jgi:hypothetical protein